MPKFIYPAPNLPQGTYLPGVGVDGAEVPSRLADEWIKAGLAVEAPQATGPVVPVAAEGSAAPPKDTQP